MKHFLPYVLLVSFLFLFTASGFAQISTPAVPPSFSLATLKNSVPVEKMREVDTQKLIEEDLVFDTIKDIPWRFGDNIMVNVNPINSGLWETLENGDKLWRVAISSPGAYSINLTFDQYLLPPGAQLFVYNQDKSRILGAFTDYNNQEDGYFATTLVDGDFITIEYYEPANAEFQGLLNLERVTHAYRSPYDYSKGFGHSGSCNLNVACEEAALWQQQVRSVGMLVSGGNGFCTGALINNTGSDGTPYFLSANHCYSNPSSVVFWFNWQSETCSNPPSSPPYNSMSGATQIARNASSDFWLMELNQPVPDEYNPFYAGWNRVLESTLTETIIGVHHPRGDIKKFSYAEEGVQAANYLQGPGSGTTHWRIVWSGGTTTEPASSGSPVFDDQGRIIGQLHGGYAACGNTEPDWYGRLGVSWTGGGSPATRLSDWLDPNGTDLIALNGYDPFDSGIENPENFMANAASSQEILLQWNLNIDQNNVLIAVNDENTFGIPEGGYTLGEEMENGGSIIYMGTGGEFLHQNLQPAENYYYRIWSYSQELVYSNGAGADAITPCSAENVFPVFEGFNTEEIPVCWKQEFVDEEITWLVGEGNNDGYPTSPFEGESNVFFRISAVEDIGKRTKLVSPLLDMTPWQNAQLSFHYANPASQANQDILRVYYRVQPDAEWLLLESFAANQFSWANASISLPEVSSQMQIAFEGEGKRGRGISIDQVEVFVSLEEEIPAPVNLTVTLTNDNAPELLWETETTGPKNVATFDGFTIFRNDNIIYEGNNPLQTSFSDQALPVGEYTYIVRARFGENIFSDPSNEASINIEASGNEFDLSISTTGEGQTFPLAGEYAYLPGSQVNIMAMAGVNWNLSHWTINGNDAGDEQNLDITMDASKDVEAVFQINQYPVFVQAEPADAATFLSGDGIYEHGTMAPFIAQPAVGFVFKHWTELNSVVSTTADMQLEITRERNLTAEFYMQDYELELEVFPGEAGTASGAGVYPANAEVFINAIADSVWVFSHWSHVVNDQEEVFSHDSNLSFILDKNMLLIANFELFMPTVEISVEGMGTTTPEPGTYSYGYGEELVLTAEAAENWKFMKWIINEEESQVPQLLMYLEEDINATAVFELASSIAYNEQKQGLKIYPVPASGTINIDFPEGGLWDIRILNLTGQQMKSISITGNSHIDIENLPSGIYLVRASKEDVVLRGRFVVE